MLESSLQACLALFALVDPVGFGRNPQQPGAKANRALALVAGLLYSSFQPALIGVHDSVGLLEGSLQIHRGCNGNCSSTHRNVNL